MKITYYIYYNIIHIVSANTLLPIGEQYRLEYKSNDPTINWPHTIRFCLNELYLVVTPETAIGNATSPNKHCKWTFVFCKIEYVVHWSPDKNWSISVGYIKPYPCTWWQHLFGLWNVATRLSIELRHTTHFRRFCIVPRMENILYPIFLQ